MKQEATCWSVSAWATVKESGPANLLVSESKKSTCESLWREDKVADESVSRS